MQEYDVDQKTANVKFRREVKERSDVLINYFLPVYFVTGLVLAFFYDTWLISVGVGSLSLISYYSAKKALPDSSLYQYVLSAVLGLFMAQYIYQMHGLFEMHFFAFIGSAVLITYQNWKLQIPMVFFVVVHHLLFGYLQNSGFQNIYFTQLEFFDIPVFIIHIVLSGVIFFICGLWSYQLKKYSEKSISQSIELTKLQRASSLSAQLKQSEQRFSALIQKGSDMIGIIDENAIYKFVSPSVFNYLGYLPEQMTGKDAKSFIHPDDLKATLNNLELVFSTKEIRLPPFRLKHANGHWRWVETIVTNMLDNPAVDGVVCNTRDITRRKQTELEREQIIKELTKSNADLKQFSYITSHNLRSPLCNMMGIMKLMDYSSFTDDNQQMITMLQASTKQLSTTIDDLTNILLIKNNTDVQIDQFSVQEVFEYAYNIFAEALKKVNGTIETDFSNCVLHFNRAYMESIFINLISNAIKYHQPGRNLLIKIGCKMSARNHTVLTFTDNGLGIDVDRYKDRLFGLYQRFHSAGSGSGLGLFIIKEQVVALGGKIDVQSEPGKGTTFSITLKRKRPVHSYSYDI